MDDGDAALYEAHGCELLRFATVLVGRADAEDVLADAVLGAFASAAWRRGVVREPRAYLFRAVANRARQEHRSRSRRLRREERAAPIERFEDPSSADPAMVDAIRSLDQRARAVLHLTYWLDLDATAVAHALDLSLRTVQRELTTARRALKELLHDAVDA